MLYIFSADSDLLSEYFQTFTRIILPKLKMLFPNGNTLSKVNDTNKWTYQYDSVNRLTEVQNNDKVGGTYTYDGNSYLSKKTEWNPDSQQYEIVIYLYLHGDVYYEENLTTGCDAIYIHGPTGRIAEKFRKYFSKGCAQGMQYYSGKEYDAIFEDANKKADNLLREVQEATASCLATAGFQIPMKGPITMTLNALKTTYETYVPTKIAVKHSKEEEKDAGGGFGLVAVGCLF